MTPSLRRDTKEEALMRCECVVLCFVMGTASQHDTQLAR